MKDVDILDYKASLTEETADNIEYLFRIFCQTVEDPDENDAEEEC